MSCLLQAGLPPVGLHYKKLLLDRPATYRPTLQQACHELCLLLGRPAAYMPTLQQATARQACPISLLTLQQLLLGRLAAYRPTLQQASARKACRL